MCGHVCGLRGRTGDGRSADTGGRRRAQTGCGIDGSGGGGQDKIAMSRQGRGLPGRTDGQAGTSNDGLLLLLRFRKGAKYCDQRVCLSICLSVCLAVRKKAHIQLGKTLRHSLRLSRQPVVPG